METTITKKVPFSFPVDIVKQQTEEGTLHVVGYAAATTLDRQGDIITPEALESAAQDLLQNPTLFLDHDPKRAIGRITSVKADKNGLLIDAVISQAEPEIATKVREGVLAAFSIRGQVLERERKFSKEHDRVVNIIRRLSLIEASLVGIPANAQARAIGWYISKALDEEDPEGGNDMNDVIVEPISVEGGASAGAGGPAPGAQPAPGKEHGAPQPQGLAPQDAPKAPEQPQGAPGGQAAPQAKPPEVNVQEEVSKALTAKMSAMLEPVLMLMDKLSGQVGEDAKPLAQQIKAMLLTLTGKPGAAPAPAAAGGISKADVAALVSAEVQKQLKKTLEEIPTLRKGLVSQEGGGGPQGGQAEAEEVMKAFGKLDPGDKLRTLLKVEHGRRQG